MTITLTPEIEGAVAERAREQGTSPERVVADGLRKLFLSDGPGEQNQQLSDYAISTAQAGKIRASLAPFMADWEQPEMSIYDDYDSAKARLEAR